MRVLLVNDLPPGPTGGAEVHVGRLADALTALGCRVHTFFPERRHGGVRRVLDLWDPFARAELRRVVRSFGPDVVHYHNLLNELSTSVVGLGVPSVLTVHDPRLLGIRFGLDQDRSPWAPDVALRSAKNLLARVRLRRSVDATVAPSRALADALRAAGFPSVHHVENAAATVSAAELGDEVVYVGSLRTHKGPQVLLEAWTRIAERHPGVVVRFVGDGPLRSEIERTARCAGLADRVVTAGQVDPDDVPSELRRAAVVVVPSLGVEGGGPTLSVIDAMATGRGVVVSDRPGVTEGVDPEVGVVVPAGDPAALASALDGLLGDRSRLEALGRAAAQRAVERWAPEIAAGRLLAVYESLL